MVVRSSQAARSAPQGGLGLADVDPEGQRILRRSATIVGDSTDLEDGAERLVALVLIAGTLSRSVDSTAVRAHGVDVCQVSAIGSYPDAQYCRPI